MVEIHWLEHSTYVPWYYVWVPSILVIILSIVIALICISKKEYVCPECKGIFKPKWYEFSATIHINDSRVMRCPKCGRKGFCNRKR